MFRQLISSPALLRLWCFLLLGLTVNTHATQYKVVNNCPSSVSLYIGGVFDSTLAKGGSTTKALGPDAGFFYTTTNGGTVDGAATRAGFYGDSNSHYYYVVKDTTHFNTGISITPNYSPSGGFCVVAHCDDTSCSTAFSQPPTRFPPPASTPPAPPVYSCPHNDVSYTITFCPSGSFPGGPISSSHAIHPNFNTNKCMDVRGAKYANGTPVQIYDCNGTGAQKWVLNKGSTKVQLAGTNFCLDAGSTPGNAVGMKIWQCYDNLPAQQWFYTDDNRIALEGKGLCLDLTNGVLTNSNQLQTWKCTNGNNNQVWSE
ncbi:hypothetical protein GALMADRAFT_205989 [Galerina marginata CBS 339.88]|uniref:Ricin B lectin domain-containing protein n=1 Tax=Galerina marginata (strain CBS 339.88) TaxID=685588 RepID=A0A067TZ19_GALM3|nr:hypothetical protein GALMADRAFT_205989 [Galerina marginata CBS 339.88]